jgi:hypothetical protein
MRKVDEARLRRAAEAVREAARARLHARGRPTTGRRIRGIVWWDQDDEPPEPWIMVGEDHPDGPAGDPVLAILESARFADMYFVTTLGQFRAGEPPQAIALGKWWRVVEFDA